MRSDTEKRLRALEERTAADLARRVDCSGYYLGSADHDADDEEEVYQDGTGLLVLRNRESGKVRGVFVDRRTDSEILRDGGDPIWL